MYLHRGLALCALLTLAPCPALAANPAIIDTGQLTCFSATVAAGSVSASVPDPEPAGFDEQDCTRGASAADAVGVLYKVGESDTPGRDYSKVANDGSVLPASAALGPGAGDWACTRDNSTGLVWEIRTDDDGLRDKDHTYTWFDPAGSDADETRGDPGTNTCGGTLPGNQCNIAAYRDAVNALLGADRLCGQTDWRLPTPMELASLWDLGRSNPAVNLAWFPNLYPVANAVTFTPYWTGTLSAYQPGIAHGLQMEDGGASGYYFGDALPVVLVRGDS